MGMWRKKARLDILGVLELVRPGRLRWFGHVERKSSDVCVNTYALG